MRQQTRSAPVIDQSIDRSRFVREAANAFAFDSAAWGGIGRQHHSNAGARPAAAGMH
jgi:hypothetical protein